MNTAILIIALIILVIGLALLIWGIGAHENFVQNNAGVQPSWVWWLIFGGLALIIIGGILLAFSGTRKSPPPQAQPMYYKPACPPPMPACPTGCPPAAWTAPAAPSVAGLVITPDVASAYPY